MKNTNESIEEKEVKVVDEVNIEETVEAVEEVKEEAKRRKPKKTKSETKGSKQIVKLTQRLVTFADGRSLKIESKKQHSDLVKRRG